jgi:predicted dehydrogenase
MSFPSRRDFFRDSAFLAAAGTALTQIGRAQEKKEEKKSKKRQKVGPNERVRVAVIGFNGQGMSHIKSLANQPDAEVVMLCDADSKVAAKGIKAALEAQDREPGFVQDLRKIMDDKTIDAVSIATPNHWHALAAIWAIQAGKDVYVEKPVSHNVSEGRRIVEFARKNNKIVQTGTQSRSMAGMQQSIDFIRSGKIGDVKLAYGLCYKPRGSIGQVTSPPKIPDTVDYNLWCGPAPLEGPNRNSVVHGPIHYDWHWFWNYGNGDLGNQGIHEMDKARWGLNLNRLPDMIWSLGGRFGYVDTAETPNTQVCLYNYGKEGCRIIFEVRGLKTDAYKGAKIGNIWVGSEGFVVSNSYSGGIAYRPNGEKIQEFKGGGDHFANFLKAVKSRKHTDLAADIEQGHLSSALCHLGNVSYRLGKVASTEEVAKLLDDPKSSGCCEEGADAIGRMRNHLANVGANLTNLFHIGKGLSFDSASETFKNDSQADAMLTREYRKGFEVPAKV